ncbi:hypothetical protein DV738_g2349, partial [Chaetothyriales sp. CBS 135597]
MKPELPRGHVLLHAGDLSQYGLFDEIQAQLDWLNSQPHLHKIIVPGNHDLLLDPDFVKTHPDRELDSIPGKRYRDLRWGDVKCLADSYTEIVIGQQILTVFGSPLTPRCGNFAFQYEPDTDVWHNKLPDNVDILLTHGPPALHLDKDKGVAVAGATGNLGPHIVNALIAAKHPVTILTRQGSSNASKLPKSDLITIKEVDLTSVASLTPALEGVEVVVSVVASASAGSQNPLIDASIAAGVRRFLPSEFGSNTVNPKSEQLPVFQYKVETRKYLEAKARDHPGFSYTVVANGPFFDWGLQVGFFLNPAQHSAVVYNGGDVKFSTTTLASIGKAVVGVVAHQDETRNRAVYVQDALVSQNQLIQYAKEVDGKEWQITNKTTDETRAQAFEALKSGPAPENFGAVLVTFIYSSVFGEGYGGNFSAHLDNDLLGIKPFSDDEVKKLVASFL